MDNPRVRLKHAMGSELNGTLGQHIYSLTMTRSNANNGSRIKCVAAGGMLPQSASSGLGYSQFGSIWKTDLRL